MVKDIRRQTRRHFSAVDKIRIVLELMKGAITVRIDHLHPEIHPQMRVVKDMAAGGVLIGAITALAIATLLALGSF